MTVTVKLYLAFRLGRFATGTLQLAPPATVGHVVDQLGLADDEIGMALVNGRQAELDHALGRDDVVQLFPVVGGG